MVMLELEKVNKRFGGLVAVANLDLSVQAGEIVGIIGPNGAGKTTVFNLISGALVPDSGVIRFQGVPIQGRKPHQVCRSGIARTFQSVRLFPNLTVFENVMAGRVFGEGGRHSKAGIESEVRAVLNFVGLSGMADTPARDLTLVNQKWLEVARALATGPKLLLLDELMAGLNPTEVAAAMDLITRVRAQGITVVMIEHVMKAVMGVCDRIVVLHHGEKIAEGLPEEISQNPRVIEVYLGE